MALIQITLLPDAPSRNDQPATFIVDADAWVAAIALWTTQANALGVQVNVSAEIAVGSANFVGQWSDQSGSLNVPASVEHNDKVYLLLNNLGNVALSEPGVTTDWLNVTPGTLSLNPIGAYAESHVDVPVLNIDLSQGNHFSKTITANSIFTFGGILTGGSEFFTLELTIVGSFVPTFPDSVTKWVNGDAGLAPSVPGDTTNVYLFESHDGAGVTFTGFYVGEAETP